jgi:two-component system, OmpR family, sensor histidine kinase ChvG
MSLRLKLLLLSLLTLTLPWAGCQYAREMESVLREAEKQALVAVAQTIAASLQGRTDLLYRNAGLPDAPRNPFDLQPVPLAGEPFLDGNVEEWPRSAAGWRWFSRGAERLGILTGVHERMLYALLEVRDDRPIFGAASAGPLDTPAFGDRIWLGFDEPEGPERQVFLAATSAGPVRAQRIETRELGRQVAVEEPRITGAWRLIPGGYRVELQVPLSMIGTRFGVLVDDRDERGAVPASFGTLRGDDLRTRGRLIAASPELTAYLSQFMQPGLALTVTTAPGARLAETNALGQPAAESGQTRGLLGRLYRRLLDRPGQPTFTQASAPIYDQERSRVIGQLNVTQTADRWLALRDKALTTLVNVTLFTSALAVLGMFAFAAYLGLRLARLRTASENALTREGLVTRFPETQARDELGDVARSFSTLLSRLADYTGYLRTLAGKLAHEIRTPLTIVRSSLENLQSEGITPGARIYVDRALQGSERLNAIVVAMGAATRVEEAIQNAERTRFELAPVIASAVESYRIGFPQRQFACELAAETVTVEGAPDLVVQMLDKLIENAVDFSPEGATITVRLTAETDAACLEVDNPGPTLPAQARGRLFESLWQSRPGKDSSRPHFGLGLYIVKLIADFHGGSAAATDRPDRSGVRLSVRFPRLS